MTVQEIAKTVLLAHEVQRVAADEGDPIDISSSFIAACEEMHLDRRLGLLLYYANVWHRDLNQWAQDILEETGQ